MHGQTKKKDLVVTVLVVDCILYLCIMCLLFHISVEYIFKFLFLNLIAIILPGFALLTILKIRLTIVGTFCMSYILGYAFVVLEYFIAEFFNRCIPFNVLVILCGFFSGLIISKIKRNNNIITCEMSDSDIIGIIFLNIFLMLNILVYSANYLGTDVVPVFRAHRDMQYWVNNTVALKIAWPADNLFMVGNRLNYHYFSSIAIAFLCEAFDIDVFTMSFPFYAMTKTIVMVGSVQFFLDSIKVNKKWTCIGYILILCTTGVEVVSVVTYYHHTLCSPFGFDIGYAYGLVFCALLFRQWNKDIFDIRIFFATMLIWAMCVGAKAPVASVLLFYAAFVCLYWLLHKKWALAWGYGICILGTFLVICKFCVGMFSVAKGEATWSLGLYDLESMVSIIEPESWAFFTKLFLRVAKDNSFLLIFIRVICINPVIILGTICSVIIVTRLKIQHNISGKDFYLHISLWLTALIGITLGIIVNAGGHSEMYFSMAALIPMLGTIFLTRINYNNDIKAREIKLQWFWGLILLVGVYRFAWASWDGVGAIKNSIEGVKNIYYSLQEQDYSEQVVTGIRDTDVEALNWIRDNTEADAVIMTDKAIITDNSAYYLYGIFCERQQYIEGTNMLDLAGKDIILQNEILTRKELVSSVYNNEKGAIGKAKCEGIDYIVQTVDITPNFIYDEGSLDLVKSTETINVYKIR